MKRLLLSLLGVLTCIHILATEQTWTYTQTTSTNPWSANATTATLSNMSWFITTDTSYFGTTSTTGATKRFMQFGSSNNAVSYVKLNSEAFQGTISKIVVNGYSNTSGNTLAVTVGGNSFGTTQTMPSSQSATADMTFEGSASGEIILNFTQNTSKKIICIYSITITYDPDAETGGGGSETTTGTISFSPANGSTVAPGDEITISTNASDAVITWSTSEGDSGTGSTVTVPSDITATSFTVPVG